MNILGSDIDLAGPEASYKLARKLGFKDETMKQIPGMEKVMWTDFRERVIAEIKGQMAKGSAIEFARKHQLDMDVARLAAEGIARRHYGVKF